MGVRMFFRWLARQNHILSNPASELELPRREKRLPKHVLTISEAEAVINQSNPNEPLGLRDRHPGDVLFNRHAAHGVGQLKALRRRL